MANDAQRRTLMVRYMLGQVSAQERDELEEQYFADNDLFEDLVAEENNLIDAYVRGQLSRTDRILFESRFLATPERRERVAFAESLAGRGSSPFPGDSKVLWWRAIRQDAAASGARIAFSAMILGLLVCSIWMVVSNRQLHRELMEVKTEKQHLEQQQQDLQRQIGSLAAQMRQLQANNDVHEISSGDINQTVASLTLLPGLSRSSGKQNILAISSRVSTVRLLLTTGNDTFSTYSVSLETPDGTQILQQNGLKGEPSKAGKVISVNFPSVSVPRGDYIVRLIGNSAGHPEEAAAYSFQVVTR